MSLSCSSSCFKFSTFLFSGLKSSDAILEKMKCTLCDFQGFYEQQYQDHILTHKEVRKCKCCKFAALQQDTLIEHFKVTRFFFISCLFQRKSLAILIARLSSSSLLSCKNFNVANYSKSIKGINTKLGYLPIMTGCSCRTRGIPLES